MGYFDNFTQEDSLYKTWLAWGIIGIIVFLMVVAALVLYIKDKVKKGYSFATVGVVMLYVLLTIIWWLAMYGGNNNNKSSDDIGPDDFSAAEAAAAKCVEKCGADIDCIMSCASVIRPP